MKLKLFAIGMLIILFILNINNIPSAIFSDSTISYSNEDLNVTITDSFGKEIEADLKSHSSVNEVKGVARGNDVPVMWYDINSVEGYADGLGDVEFRNIETGEERILPYYFAEVVQGEIEVPLLENVCVQIINSSGTYDICSDVVKGNQTIIGDVYKKLDTRDIPSGTHRIALMTYVGYGETIDGVWTLAGQKIMKHASWSNNTDGFVIAPASSIHSVATNMSEGATDFWVLDSGSRAIQHYNRTGSNVSGGFSVSIAIGTTTPEGITTNNTDFWITSRDSETVSHVTMTGVNQSDAFPISNCMTAGDSRPRGITTNGTELWVLLINGKVCHFDMFGNNRSGSFDSSLASPTMNPTGLATNGSDFWVSTYTPGWIYHYDRTGNNQTDGFPSTPIWGGTMANMRGIAMNDTNSMWALKDAGTFLFHADTNPDLISTYINITSPTNYTNSSDTSLDILYVRTELNLQSCWYSNDTYSVNTTLVNCGNITTLTWSNAFHNLTVYANDSSGNYNFSSVSFTIDTINPDLTIFAPNGSISSLTPQILLNVSDANSEFCGYNVTTLADTSSEVISFRQMGNCTDDIIPSGQLGNNINYAIFVFANDSAGNTNITNSTFTTPASAGGGGGGGGGGGETSIFAVALITPENLTGGYSNLSKSKIYARIFELNLSKTQTINQTQKNNLIVILNGQGVQVNNQTIDLWLSQFRLGKVENVKVFLQDAEQFNLVTLEVKIIPLKFEVISPTNFDSIRILLPEMSEVSQIVQLNKLVQNCSILQSDAGFSCPPQGSIVIVKFLIPESLRDSTFLVAKAKLSYTSNEGENAFQDAQFRIILINQKLIFSILAVLSVSGLFFYERKRIMIRVKGVFKKKKR